MSSIKIFIMVFISSVFINTFAQQKSMDLADAVAQTAPSVVSIHVLLNKTDVKHVGNQTDKKNSLFHDFFKLSPKKDHGHQPPAVSGGSGFFYKDGYILTNAHVVVGAKKINVKLQDGKELAARLVGHDSLTDIAVLAVDGKAYRPVTFSQRNLRIGDFVFAIGAPYGLENTVSQGIVSSLNRALPGGKGFSNFIQTFGLDL